MQTNWHRFFVLIAVAAFLGCTKNNGTSNAFVKLTKFDKAEYCDIAVGNDGTLHVVFTDRPAYDKPMYLYHRTSKDEGKTWTEATNISDDESGLSASFCRLMADGSGRIYAIWKYVNAHELLDGPGGNATGKIVFRALEGGAWSKQQLIGDPKVPSYSWFSALDAKGAVHVVWSQMSKEAMEIQQSGYSWYASLVRHGVLEGATLKEVKDLIKPSPIMTKAQQEEEKKAGRYPKYEDTVPRREGLINLRGFIDAQGVAKFVAENTGYVNDSQMGKQVVVWDGAKLKPYYTFDRFETHNIFNNPPALLPDPAGNLHLIRAPEKASVSTVRDYSLGEDKLELNTDILRPKNESGKVFNWQVHALPGNKIAVTGTVSEKGGSRPDDMEMFLTINADGKTWSPPVKITKNQGRESGSTKETTPGNSVGLYKSYAARFANMKEGKNGEKYVVVIVNEDSLLGLTSSGVTSSGRAVTSTGTARIDAPAVHFYKLK